MTEALEDDPFLHDLPDQEIEMTVISGFRSRVRPILERLSANGVATKDIEAEISRTSITGALAQSSELNSVFKVCHGALEEQWRKGQDDNAMLEISQLFSVLSRERTWAIAFTENGILDFYLNKLRPQVNDSDQWVDGAVRLIANCCSRSARTKHSTFSRAPLARLVDRLEDDSTADTAAMAIYAISNGVTEALRLLEQEHHLISCMIRGLSKDFYQDEHLDFVFELVDGALSYVPADDFDDSQLVSIFNCMIELDISTENFIVLVNLTSMLLDSERLRQIILEDRLDHLMAAFLSTFPSDKVSDVDHDFTDHVHEDRDLTMEEDITVIRSNIILLFGKITLALDQLQSIDRQMPKMLDWLQAREPQVRICACVFFGNIAFNHPQLGTTMLADHRLGDNLSKCLSSTSDREVLTSALELLQNLAKSENRDILGRSRILESLAGHWETFGMHSGRALYHTRQLLNNSVINTSRFLGLVPDVIPDSRHQHSLLQCLLTMFGETTDSTMKAETGQVVAEIWRNISRNTGSREGRRGPSSNHTDALNRPSRSTENVSEYIGLQSSSMNTNKASGKNSSLSRDFNALALDSGSLSELFAISENVSILDPVIHMIRCDNESLISLGWFTLSLMARQPEGAAAIYHNFVNTDDGFELVRRTTDSSNTQAGARNNALYLIATLTRQLSSDEDCMRRLGDLPMKVAVDDNLE